MTDHQPELIREERPEYSALDPSRRDEYRRRLAEYLKDAEFRAIEGFPIGTDEDILALSDPPYYTACPNPFLPEIISEWQLERETLRQKMGLNEETYQREPFAADVSEGKNDPIYNAHSYHTKVPHKAIMRYILHYTDPGDNVFDGFCGTGMTGVAAQLCGDKKAVEELGYRVDAEGLVWEGNKAISRLGTRKAVLNDLSPAATFIAYNYNTPVDAAAFEHEARYISREVEEQCGWMYETWHPNCENQNRTKGIINFTIWSDVYICPECSNEMIYWDVAVKLPGYVFVDEWLCPKCGTKLSKNPSAGSGAIRAEHVWETIYDRALKKSIKKKKKVPAFISYSSGNKTVDKKPDSEDLRKVRQIEELPLETFIPTSRMPAGDESRRNDDDGITHTHHFYTSRNLYVMSFLFDKLNSFPFLKFGLLNTSWHATLMRRFNAGGGHRPLSGTLYIPSLASEGNMIAVYEHKLKQLKDFLLYRGNRENLSITETTSSTQSGLKGNSIEYIFIDPPFGSNLMYSELNFIWESWLKVITNNNQEAIVNKVQEKGLPVYQLLMQDCFSDFFRILKPGHWMTIEFHNSQNLIWIAIQEAILRSGFIIADVRVLDKQQGSFKQYTSTGAVKQDLIISAYKPNGNLEENFHLKAGTEDGVWEIVRYHLGKLPITNKINSNLVINAERQAFLLFDRMVAFHIQRGVMVPLSSPEFYAGLEQRFIRRDGMYFLPDQVAEYDRALLDSGKPTQIPLFVMDEKTAITWLHQQLDPSSSGEPQTRGDLTNPFNQAMHRAKHEKALELIEILQQNFLEDETGKWYVPDHNKASDLDKLRHRSLLHEFNEYASGTGRLRQFRTEAVRAGFADCFKRKDFGTILKVAERLPEEVLREDPDLLMYYDSAMLRKK